MISRAAKHALGVGHGLHFAERGLPGRVIEAARTGDDGSAKQAAGKIKEFAGKVTGDAKTESEGKADQVKGKFQNVVGGLKDAVRGK